MYTFEQALDIVEEIQYEQGEGLLETLMYMQDNLDQFSDSQVRAYRKVFSEMRKLFVK
jgi:hypothetical protein